MKRTGPGFESTGPDAATVENMKKLLAFMTPNMVEDWFTNLEKRAAELKPLADEYTLVASTLAWVRPFLGGRGIKVVPENDMEDRAAGSPPAEGRGRPGIKITPTRVGGEGVDGDAQKLPRYYSQTQAILEKLPGGFRKEDYPYISRITNKSLYDPEFNRGVQLADNSIVPVLFLDALRLVEVFFKGQASVREITLLLNVNYNDINNLYYKLFLRGLLAANGSRPVYWSVNKQLLPLPELPTGDTGWSDVAVVKGGKLNPRMKTGATRIKEKNLTSEDVGSISRAILELLKEGGKSVGDLAVALHPVYRVTYQQTFAILRKLYFEGRTWKDDGYGGSYYLPGGGGRPYRSYQKTEGESGSVTGPGPGPGPNKVEGGDSSPAARETPTPTPAPDLAQPKAAGAGAAQFVQANAPAQPPDRPPVRDLPQIKDLTMGGVDIAELLRNVPPRPAERPSVLNNIAEKMRGISNGPGAAKGPGANKN